MGFCLFIKPFRSLKGKMQIKGDLKRHSFASLVRSSFISGASVDRRSLYFLDKESSPRFTTTLHHQHDDGSIAYGQTYKGQPDVSSPDLDDNGHDESNETEEEKELEIISQNAVEDALSTIAEEYLENFANILVENTLKKIQSVENVDDITVEQQVRTTVQEPNNEKPDTGKQVHSDAVPFREPNILHNDNLSPTDYTTLCVPRDYCIFGNKVEKMAKEDREAMLSKRGMWPSDEAIEYQFEFVEMMKSIEAENKKAEREVDDHTVALSRLISVDVRDSEESDDETSDDDDDDGLTITFEVGPSEINRYPDRRSHCESNEGGPSDCMLDKEDELPASPLPSPSQSDSWIDTPTRHSPPVSASPPPYRRCPPPPPSSPSSHFIYHHDHPAPRHPMMGASREAHVTHQMKMMKRGDVGAKECEGVHHGHGSRTVYPRQWQDRRQYESPPLSRAPPYPGTTNFRNGQRFGPRCDRRQNHYQDRDHFTASNQPTYSDHGRYQHQPRPRPTPFPYNPSRQSTNHERAPPPSCRQAARWDKPVHQSHPFRQEWGGPSQQFGSSYHPHHHHHHYHHLHHNDVDRNNINRRHQR